MRLDINSSSLAVNILFVLGAYNVEKYVSL